MEFVRRHSLSITTLFLLFCSSQLMSLSVRDPQIARAGAGAVHTVISPAVAFYHRVTSAGTHVWEQYIWLLNVENERDEYRSRVKALEAQNARLSELESENQRLRGLLSFSERTSLRGISATVVGGNPSHWTRMIAIDRGSADGIKPGFPVVDGNAVVGQITAVSANGSKVLLLTDTLSAVGGLVQSSRSPGIVEGSPSGKLFLRYLVKENPVTLGDRIVASGLDGVFPKGVLIGIVTAVDSSQPGLFQQIEMKPSVDVNRLENVLVLVPDWNSGFKEQYQPQTTTGEVGP